MTSPTEPDQARALRRRHTHERQAVVYGLLIALLAVCGIGALAIYTGAIKAPFDRDFTTAAANDEFADNKVPCLPDGTPTLPVPYNEIHVSVYNASDRGGIAAAVADVLADRGFVIDETGNAPTTLEQTPISFGAAGQAAAYTLAAQFPEPVLLLDARTDATVDVSTGSEFTRLVDPKLVGLDFAKPLVNPKGCVDISTITPRAAPVPETPAAS